MADLSELLAVRTPPDVRPALALRPRLAQITPFAVGPACALHAQNFSVASRPQTRPRAQACYQPAVQLDGTGPASDPVGCVLRETRLEGRAPNLAVGSLANLCTISTRHSMVGRLRQRGSAAAGVYASCIASFCA
jgi:hypothetical protein